MPESSLRRSLSTKYIVALALVAALACASFGVLTWVMAAQEADAPTINVSGRQRMLSQRVSLMALRYATAPSTEERDKVGALLDDAIALMDRSHQGLVSGSAELGIRAEKSEAVQALYFEPVQVDARVQSYLDDARALRALPPHALSADHPLLQSMLARSQKPLLRDLNEAVKAYEKEGSGRVSLLQQAQLGLLVLTLGLLVAEGVWIFGPMVNRIVRMVDALHEQEAVVRAREASLRLVLDSTADGLMPVDGQGRVAAGSSARIAEWFRPPSVGQPFWEVLAPEGHALRVQLELGFGQLTDSLLPPELLLAQMPSAFDREDRHYALSYAPIEDQSGGYLITVRDVTAELEAERARAQAQELQDVLMRTVRARDTFESFVEETDRLIREAGAAPNPDSALRHLHTLKGNTGIYGFRTLSELIHGIESHLSEEPSSDVGELVDRIRSRWQFDYERVNELLGSHEEGVWIDPDEHAEHLRAVATDPREALRATVSRWRLEPAVRRLKHLASAAERIASRLGKPVDVDVGGNWVRLPSRRFGPLWSALVHVVRNAVDHGIESPEAREKAGKPSQGAIALTTQFIEDELVIQIQDDGGGIDWERLRAKARAQGLAGADEADPTSLLFASGLSGRDEVTDLSGRGVGMGAVSEVVAQLGGTIDVESRLEQGTTFRFRFPIRSVPELDISVAA